MAAPGRRGARPARGLWLRGDPGAGRGAHRALQARHRRVHRRGREGDVHLHRPGRRQPDAASRGYRGHRARHDFQRPAARCAPQAVVHRTDVPPREAAEGSLSAVLSGRCGGGGVCRSRRGCGTDRADGAAVARAGHHAGAAADQLARHRGVAACLPRAADRVFLGSPRAPRRGQPPAPATAIRCASWTARIRICSS